MAADWERVTRLFDAARLLDVPARLAFLDAACAGDPALRHEVDALLSADAIDDEFLSAPPRTAIAEALRHAIRPLPDGVVLKERYVVECRLASGGQALVYRAMDRLLSRRVVVKVMRAADHQNALLKARFEEERQALARIDHPAVVGILDVGDLDDGSPYLVLQYIDGVSLRELARRGPVGVPRAVGILQAIAAALDAAHAAGVGHHDLKPENVMVQPQADGTDVVRLIDFGIAKIDRVVPTFTTVLFAGSVRYMAPEQFEGRNQPASDLYALGALACELLYGQADIRAVKASVDRRVRRLLEAAVAFDPQDRPERAAMWAGELAAALQQRGDDRRLWTRAAPLAATLLLAALIAAGLMARDGGSDARIIEKVGAFDPLREGFREHGALFGTVVPNAERSGFIGWSIATREPGGGYYFHPLSSGQKRAALGRGWVLSAVLQPNEGGASAVADFAGVGHRFDINVFAEPDADLVRVNTQLVPTIEGLELRLPRLATGYRKYELRFDASLQTADLWIDGEKRLTGYRGHTQFQEDTHGVAFGTAPYKSERGMASFQVVRFEIHP